MPASRLTLPSRFAVVSRWDVVRDLAAAAALVSAYTVPYTQADIGRWMLVPRIAIALGLAAIITAHLLRWIPEHPRLDVIRLVRLAGLVPAIVVAVATVLVDLALSLPVLFAPLPDGPPVGIGVGVSLLLIGGILGCEPRAHCGYLPGQHERSRSRIVLRAVAWIALAQFAVFLVMVIGRLLTTGWAFSALALADGLLSALVLVVVIGAGLRRERSRYVFAMAACAGLVIGAVTDNTLRLQFAAPVSAATGFVYLPLLFGAFAIMASRAFVRSMPLSFRRADWIVYALRALELSTVLHIGAAVWGVLAAIAAAGGVGRAGPVLCLIDAVLAVLFAVVSACGRRALLGRSADVARASAVIASVVLVVIGFLDVIVNSVATGAGAGLVTGGVALATGIAVALMLTVPQPVRDQYGAPDLVRMFDDFRRRDADARSLLARVPDVREESSTRKIFPGA